MTLRRWGCILAMLLAPWGFAITNLCYALAIRGGGSDNTGAEAIALFGAHPSLVRVGLTAGMIGCILIIPAVSGLFRLAPHSRTVLIGGSRVDHGGPRGLVGCVGRGGVARRVSCSGIHPPLSNPATMSSR